VLRVVGYRGPGSPAGGPGRPAFDVSALVEASDGFRGSEIEQAVTAALLGALQRKTQLTTAMSVEELRSTVPLSVSRRENVARLRATAQGRFVPVA
jgi:hypothetical protein